jgi:hypothetical protein
MSARPSYSMLRAIDVTYGSSGAMTRPREMYGRLYERTGIPSSTTVSVAAASGKITAEPRYTGRE